MKIQYKTSNKTYYYDDFPKYIEALNPVEFATVYSDDLKPSTKKTPE